MQFSSFKKPFEERIKAWDEQLSLVSEVIEEWLAVQSNWLYLQPIFDSPDILKQLPVEGKRFQKADRNWRVTMSQVKKKIIKKIFLFFSRSILFFQKDFPPLPPPPCLFFFVVLGRAISSSSSLFLSTKIKKKSCTKRQKC